MIFCQVDAVYFLVEFEADGMRPDESTKNGRKGAHGLNCKFVSVLRTFSKSSTKITRGKIFHVSLPILNFFLLTTLDILVFLAVRGSFLFGRIEQDSKNYLKKFLKVR